MKMLMRSAIGGLALVAMMMGAGHARHDAHAAGATVTVANFSFTDGASSTSTTTINAGDTVTWTWASGTHSTTSTSVPAGAATWDSGTSGSPFSFGPTTFTVAGTYTYQCVVHPTTMTGTIVVQAAATSTAVAPTNTPAAATSTPMAATSTPVAEATTPAATTPAATATAVAASPSPALIAPAPTTASGGTAGAAALPRSGDGGSDDGSSRADWLTIGLAAAGVTALAGAGAVRVRRHRR